MSDIVMAILECIVTIVVILIARYLIPMIKSKLGESQYDLLLTFITNVVYAMQQTLEDNDVKKSTAVELVTAWINEHGIDISESEIDTLIEAAVKELKLQEESITKE